MSRIDDRWVRKDKTRTPLHGKGKRWQAVWYENGKEKKESFAVKDAAQAHLTNIDHRQRSGTYVSKELGRVHVGDLLEDWFATQLHLKPSTRNETAGDLERQIRPYWAHWVLSDIKRADVQAWVAGLRLAPTTVHTVFGRFRTFLNWCVTEGRIPSSPARGVKLPQKTKRPHTYLTPTQVQLLAECMTPHYQRLVWALALTGMRMGEMIELRYVDIDRKRKRAIVARSVAWIGGKPVVGTPKSNSGREVPLSSKVLEIIGEGPPEQLVFTSVQGQRVRPTNFRVPHMRKAVAAAVEKDPAFPAHLYPHDLRHTAASLAVSAGANVKALQRMLGHAKAEMTLSVYAGLFDTDLNDVADRLDKMFS